MPLKIIWLWGWVDEEGGGEGGEGESWEKHELVVESKRALWCCINDA